MGARSRRQGVEAERLLVRREAGRGESGRCGMVSSSQSLSTWLSTKIRHTAIPHGAGTLHTLGQDCGHGWILFAMIARSTFQPASVSTSVGPVAKQKACRRR